VLGDLAEECKLHPNPARWVRKQVLRSIPPIVWQNIRRGVWLKTLGAAVAGYAVVVVLVIANMVVLNRFAPTAQAYTIATFVADFGVMILGGYLAAWMRPRAPIALAVITAAMGVFSLVETGDKAPIEYQLLLIVIGPVGSLGGGMLRARKVRGV
jgi:peptidoglycan/LPS O-acetylase OafA/YrhL